MSHRLDETRDGGRNNAISHEAQTAPFRSEHSRRLGDWLEARRPESRRGRLLDFGCADLLLARRLHGIWIVDGFDEWPRARQAGRAQLAALGAPGVVYDDLSDIPVGSYDAIVLNSLFQYVEDAAAAERLFAAVAPLLAVDAPIGIVITDGVSEGANWFADLRDLVSFCVRVGGVVHGLLGAYWGGRAGKPARRHFIPTADLVEAAAHVGLDLVRHPENLTEFTHRATFILTHRPPG